MVKNDKMAKTDENFPQRYDGLLILVIWSKLSDSNETLQEHCPVIGRECENFHRHRCGGFFSHRLQTNKQTYVQTSDF